MACIEQKTDFNFLNWHKVVGSYTLSDLQASGVPSVCDNITDGSEGWNLSTAIFKQLEGLSHSVNKVGIFFKPDGLKMYLVGGLNDPEVYEYSLGTAWDVSTLTYVQLFDVSSKETGPYDIFFKPDGLKMYVIGTTTNTVYEYDLSTAWNVSTATFYQNGFSSSDADTWGMYFNSEGTKAYSIGTQFDTVREYDLSIPWDSSSDSFVQSLDISSQDNSPRGLFFKDDGLKMYIIGNPTNTVYEYSLGTAWDVSTATFNYGFSTSPELFPQGLFFGNNGTKMYHCGGTNREIYEYDLTD